MYITAIYSFFTSLTLGLIFTPLVIKLAKNRRWIVKPRKDRWHSRPTALMGGISIFSAFIITALIFNVFTNDNILLLIALSVMFITGWIDDLYEVKPIVKLIGQITCTLVLLYYQYYFGNGLFYWFGIPLTFFWVIGITNAINLLDNMDGLAAGISAVVSFFSGVILIQSQNFTEAFFAFSLSGSALGFLFYNFNPAKIFMGDTGSLFLGFSVSFLTLSLQKKVGSLNSFFVIILPVALMAIPIMDTSLVIIKRIIAGRKITMGGKDHTSHRLVALGLSEQRSVLLLYMISIIWGFTGLLILKLEYNTSLLLILLLSVFSLVFLFLLSSTKVYDESEEKLTYLRLRGQSLGNIFIFRFFLMNKKLIAGLVIDISIIFVSFYLSSTVTNVNIGNEYFILGIFILVKIFAFYIFNLYNRIWRYFSTNEVIIELSSVFISSTILFYIFQFKETHIKFTLSFFIVDFFITLSTIVFSRICYRIVRESFEIFNNRKVIRALVYGAGDSCNLLIKEINQNTSLNLKIVGILDDDLTKNRMYLNGVFIYGGRDRIKYSILKTKASVIIISTTKIDRRTNEQLLIAEKELGVEIRNFSINIS